MDLWVWRTAEHIVRDTGLTVGSLGVILADERALVDERSSQNTSSLGLKPAHLSFLRNSQKGEQADDTRCAQGSCCCGERPSS